MAIDINRHFAEEVRRYRKKLNKSQLELAELAKVDLSTINRVERGIANITLRSAFKIAKAMHIPMYKFFLTDDEARKEERKGHINGLPIEET